MTRTMRLMLMGGLGVWLAVPALSRAQQPAPAAPAAPAANPADVSSPDAIIAALYDVISGAAGQKRNWDRFRSLFLPGGRLIGTGQNPQGVRRYRVMTPDEYVQLSGTVLERDGFFERELHRETSTFGNVLHAFSTYDSKRKLEDPQPFARGINSIQLFNDGTRWWVVTIFWDAERANNPIPARYLP